MGKKLNSLLVTGAMFCSGVALLAEGNYYNNIGEQAYREFIRTHPRIEQMLNLKREYSTILHQLYNNGDISSLHAETRVKEILSLKRTYDALMISEGEDVFNHSQTTQIRGVHEEIKDYNQIKEQQSEMETLAMIATSFGFSFSLVSFIMYGALVELDKKRKLSEEITSSK